SRTCVLLKLPVFVFDNKMLIFILFVSFVFFFFFQAEDGIRDKLVTGVQTCALPIFPNQPATEEEQAIGEERTIANFILDPNLRRDNFVLNVQQAQERTGAEIELL